MKNNLFFTFFLLVASVAVAQEKPQGLALMSKAPDFNAKDQNGKSISLVALRKKGSVVVLFYRGNWCPYCNKQLNELQDSLQYITAKGAQVVAITPEASDGINKTIEKTGAAFSVLNDKDVVISKAYKVSYEVDTATMNMYKKNWDVDFLQINQQKEKAYLPVPAVYIVNSKGLITYRFFETDVIKRPSVKELLENLN